MNRLIDGPAKPKATFIFAHGAGAGIETEFMNVLAEGIAKANIRVIRFEFPYMTMARINKKKRAPNPMPILKSTFQQVISEIEGPVFIGGKSMGGRIASMLTATEPCLGCLCFGYPFHPIGKPQRLRIEHLKHIKKPVCILQGTRDPFGKVDEVNKYQMANTVTVHFLNNGDHSFKTRKKDQQTTEELMQEAISISINFIQEILEKSIG